MFTQPTNIKLICNKGIKKDSIQLAVYTFVCIFFVTFRMEKRSKQWERDRKQEIKEKKAKEKKAKKAKEEKSKRGEDGFMK